MRFFISFLAGCFAALAMAPVCFFPAMFISLSALYILTALSSSPLKAFLIGGAFSFGYFVCGLYWVGNALLVDGNPYLWAWPLAVAGLPLLLCVFQALACLLTKLLSDSHKLSGFFVFAAFSAISEWCRGNLFTGFPWNLYGHTWSGILRMLQILSVMNIYSLTLITILWCAAPGFIYLWSAPRKNKIILTSSLFLLFIFILAFGAYRLQTPTVANTPIDIHMVQANIPESEKWDGKKEWDHFLKHIKLSKPTADSTNRPTYIVWAETALPQWIYNKPEARYLIAQTLSAYKGDAYLLTGFLRYEPEGDRFYNSLVMIDKDGQVSNVYDKNHLVPFGEYIPYQEWIPLAPVAKFKGFSGGGGPQSFPTPSGLKYSPVICYEIIFPGAVVNEKDRPNFILNVTNDSWYGFSAGPYQHLAQATYRAIEEGTPIVRVADTGISTIIDPYGRISTESKLFTDYEKTIALPGQVVLYGYKSEHNRLVFISLVICFLAFAYISKNYNL